MKSIFTESDIRFLKCLDSFTEASKEERMKVLELAIKEIESHGKTPKIGNKEKERWIETGNSGDFKESLCIAGLGNEGLSSLATAVNKVIKPLGASVHPDNYGTMFLKMKDKMVTESYITNYFFNKILLKKFGNKPDVNKKTIEQVIDHITKKYESLSNNEEVKKIRKSDKASEFYYPVGHMEFSDKKEIQFAICFDDSAYSPGHAFYSNTIKAHVVGLVPAFFTQSRDNQIFILLHEIGHIRLNHTKSTNSHMDSDHRLNAMRKGNATYPEINADLYAILNGAKMYTIVNMAEEMDYDDKYDYRGSNAELSDRYRNVYKKVKKMKGLTYDESTCYDYHEFDYDLDIIEYIESGSDDPKQEILDHLRHYIKWCRMDDGIYCSIEALKDYIIHESKSGKKWLLLATLSRGGLSDSQLKRLLNNLHDNIRFNNEKMEFHTCYLPGDMFVYIELPDVVNEYTESTIYDSYFNAMMETETDSHIMLMEIYPKIEEVLMTTAGDKMFRQLVEAFVDRNSEKLHEPCPITMIPFTDTDKNKFFDLFNLDSKEMKKIIGKAVENVSQQAQFKLVKDNPIFVVFYFVLRYYILKNDVSGINTTLIIHALASYPSIFHKYFKYGANPGVMKYTADHLSEKFIFKQEGHVFGALRVSIESAYKFLKPYFKEANDKEIIRYIQRIRNDQNSMIKKIANEYNKNYKAGKSITTQNEVFDNGALVDDYVNNTSQVEVTAQKIIVNILTNGINLRIAETAAAMAQLSMVELRLYLTQVMIEARTSELEDFITSILFIYLYDEKHQLNEIRSRQFLSFGIELFRRTNSNNKNVATIKKMLDLWAEQIGIHSRFKREATRISYKKGIFWYIMLMIQNAS